MNNNYIAVIQAGGKGTRLRELTKDLVPKPLLKLNGKPMIEWQVECLKRYGVKEFVFITGYLGDKIEEYFGDGEALGVHISYIRETEPLGSAGALFYLKDKVQGSNFLLIFGDVMFDMEVSRMLQFHEEKGALATLLVHPNSHPQDSDLVVLDANNKVVGFDSKNNVREYWFDNCVNAGIYVLSGELLNQITAPVKTDLEKNIIFPMIKSDKIYGYRTPEYVKDAGTVERFKKVEEEQSRGLWQQKSLANKQKCIFLDRDGTVNRHNGFISKPEQLELETGVAEAIRLINASGYLAIVVTNQPVVARGMCDIADVEEIHKKLATLLGREGAYLDDIVFCPHHPDKGYPEENPKYKIVCNCRKPKTGMIDLMVEKYHIDLQESFFIGDTTMDIQTGKNASLKTILVKTGEGGRDGKYSVTADFETEDLLEAVQLILKEQ